MPINRGIDSNGPFYRWGFQKKYYYIINDPISRNKAKRKAIRQMIAIILNKY
jgi:hypothetical protein